MSRLMNRLMQIDAAYEQRSKAQAQQSAVSSQLGEAGDAFELGARMVLGAWDARRVRQHSMPYSDCTSAETFEFAYRLAAEELALVLRCMRRGCPPTPLEFREAQQRAAELSFAEPKPEYT